MQQTDCTFYGGKDHCLIHGDLKNPVLNCDTRICRFSKADKERQTKPYIIGKDYSGEQT